jgi:hypothetical protein
VAVVTTETQLLDAILDLAGYRHWLTFHPMPAYRRDGRIVTPFRGDRGYPDLTLARGGRVIHAELKDRGGRYGPGQEEWRDAIGDSHRLWRPASLDEIARELR